MVRAGKKAEERREGGRGGADEYDERKALVKLFGVAMLSLYKSINSLWWRRPL